ESRKSYKIVEADIQKEQYSLINRFYLTINWLNSYIDNDEEDMSSRGYIEEAAITLLYPKEDTQRIIAKDYAHISGLKGNHPVLHNGEQAIQYHEFLNRLTHFANFNVSRFTAFAALKEQLVRTYTTELKIGQFEPKVLTSFVRNKLIYE